MSSLRTIWQDKIRLNWPLGFFLIVVFGVSRFYLMMDANQSGSYNKVSVIFILMLVVPLLLLSRKGLYEIGVRKPTSWRWILIAALLGSLFCILVYYLGQTLYHDQIQNWFVYIGQSYQIDKSTLSADDYFIYFLIYALISISFSPIGEELMYRGLIHRCFQPRFGDYQASIIDNAAFALTHLAHFGLIYQSGIWYFLPQPAFIWVMLMFMVCRLFFLCKIKSESLVGPIVCHASFNLTMIYLIFYCIL